MYFHRLLIPRSLIPIVVYNNRQMTNIIFIMMFSFLIVMSDVLFKTEWFSRVQWSKFCTILF